MDNRFFKCLTRRQQEREQGKPEGFWHGFSVFQVPEITLKYSGQPEAVVLVNFYSRGSGVSYRACDRTDVSFKARTETLALKTGLSEKSVSRAFQQLEQDRLIHRTRQRNKRGKFLASKFLLIDPETAEVLQTQPGTYGLLSANGSKHFLTVPRDCLMEINYMEHVSSKAVYIAAFAFTSREVSETAPVEKPEWLELSGLGRNAFARGLSYCQQKKLLSFAGGILTINDPRTGQPCERWRSEPVRINHENAKWAFDLNSVTGEQWRTLIEKLLGREFYEGSDGWSATTKDIACPFCHQPRSFSVKFSTAQFTCHNCHEKGRLGQLIQRVLKMPSMAEVIRFIQERTKELEQVTV